MANDFKLRIDYQRLKGLTEQQENFLRLAIPFAKTVSYYTKVKALERVDVVQTIGALPSVLIAFVIVRSNWGRHPVAVPRYTEPKLKQKDGKPAWKHGNNLPLIYADRHWKQYRTVIEFEGFKFKSYKEISACEIDFSDIISLRPGWKRFLQSQTVEEQIECIAKRAVKRYEYALAMTALIQKLELKEFDRG